MNKTMGKSWPSPLIPIAWAVRFQKYRVDTRVFEPDGDECPCCHRRYNDLDLVVCIKCGTSMCEFCANIVHPDEVQVWMCLKCEEKDRKEGEDDEGS